MDTPKFKDVIQKLSFFKDYSSLVLPVIVTLVTVLVFVFAILLGNKLRKQIENESISMGGKTIKSLIRSTVPSDQWKIEAEYQKAYEADTDEIAVLAVQSSQRQLLSYKIFPKPKDISTLIFGEFGGRFRGAIDSLLTGINARDCPSAAELDRSIQRSRPSRSVRRRGSFSRTRGASLRTGEVENTIIEALCRAKAESASVYANSADLSGYDFWAEYEYIGIDEAVKDCWYWQLAYWIIEDVIDSTGAVNFGSNNVFTSPVKRLLYVNFTINESFGSRSRLRGQRDKDDKPAYFLSDQGTAASALTKRFSDDDIDVVHFKVCVVINTRTVLPFMKQLCSAKQHKFTGFFNNTEEQISKHNQITILASNILPIDRKSAEHSLYRYGEDTVVELDLTCEYIFNNKGYGEIKPEDIKKELKGQVSGN